MTIAFIRHVTGCCGLLGGYAYQNFNTFWERTWEFIMQSKSWFHQSLLWITYRLVVVHWVHTRVTASCEVAMHLNGVARVTAVGINPVLACTTDIMQQSQFFIHSPVYVALHQLTSPDWYDSSRTRTFYGELKLPNKPRIVWEFKHAMIFLWTGLQFSGFHWSHLQAKKERKGHCGTCGDWLWKLLWFALKQQQRQQ